MQNELTNIAQCDNIAIRDIKEAQILRKWLIELRNKNGVTQSVMAEKLGLSQSYYAQIETGERQADMNLSTACKISDIFGIPLSQIRNYEEALAENK